MPVPIGIDGSIDAVFRPLVSAFDPDHVVVFEPGLAAMSDVGEMGELVQRIRNDVGKLGVSDPEAEAEELIARQTLTWPHFASGEAVAADLGKCANPFSEKFGTPWVATCTGRGSLPAWPLTTWSAYAEPLSDIGPVVDPVCASNDDLLGAMVAWGCGRWPGGTKAELSSRNITVEEARLFETEATESLQLVFGLQAFGGSSGFSSLEAKLGRPIATAVPSAATMLDAAVHNRRATPIRQDAVLVVGDELEDFLLWVALSRLRSGVLFAPKRMVSAAARSAATTPVSTYAASIMLLLQLGDWEHVSLMSASLDRRGLGYVKSQLRRSEWRTGEGSIVDSLSTVVLPEDHNLVGNSIVVLERDPFSSSVSLSIDSHAHSHGRVPLPVPSSSRTQDLGDKRWIVEVEVQGRHLPPSIGVAREVFDNRILGEDFVRITADGTIAVWHPNFAVWSGASTAQTWSTRFVPPPRSTSLVRAILGDGYEVRPHDKGRYAAVVVERLGLDRTIGMFASPEFGRLAAAVISSEAKRSGRATTLESALSLSEEWTDELLGNGLAAIVHFAKCKTCSSLHKIPLKQVGFHEECSRCGAAMSLSSLTTDPFFRVQRFQLSEVLGLVLEHRSDSVLTAYSQSISELRHAEYVPELELRKVGEDGWSQLDVVAVGSGHLIVGEVKTGDTFGTRRERLAWRRAAAQLSDDVRPVQVRPVYAWTSAFSSAIREDLYNPDLDVDFLRIPSRPWH